MKSIVVLTQGFVLIGNYTRGAALNTLHNASVIRQWGTTAGLGELALKGATKETILDPCGSVNVPHHAEVMEILCVHKSWAKE